VALRLKLKVMSHNIGCAFSIDRHNSHAMRKIDIMYELGSVRRFAKVFGIRGLGIFYRYMLVRYGIGKAIQTVTLPRAPGTIELRKDTTDPDVFDYVFARRSYNFSYLQGYYERAVSAGEVPLVIDCGANIGITSIWYALRYPNARVYAIEPDRDNFMILQRNVKAYPNIVPLLAAVWNRSTAVEIVNRSASAWAFRVQEVAGGDIVALTVPEAMRLAGATSILLIKINIEGSEQELFRDNTEWMESTTAIAIELHDWLRPGTSRNFVTELARRPFEIIIQNDIMLCIKTPSH
jgi:FkbM family methyltransferase